MTTTVSVYDAKIQLSRLLHRVEAGEDIVIARNGRPVARLALLPEQAPHTPGAWDGRPRPAGDVVIDLDAPHDRDWFGL